MTTSARIGTELRDRLSALADLVLLGAAVSVCTVGIVTAMAGLTAAAQVLADPDDERAVLVRFAGAFRRHITPSLAAQAVVVVAAVIGVVDVVCAPELPPPLRPLVTGTGAVLLLAAAVLPVFWATAIVATTPDGPRERPGGGVGWRPVVVVAVLAAAGRPQRALAVLVLVLAAVGVVAVAAVLFPLAGALVLVALRCSVPAVAVVVGRGPRSGRRALVGPVR